MMMRVCRVRVRSLYAHAQPTPGHPHATHPPVRWPRHKHGVREERHREVHAFRGRNGTRTNGSYRTFELCCSLSVPICASEHTALVFDSLQIKLIPVIASLLNFSKAEQKAVMLPFSR